MANDKPNDEKGEEETIVQKAVKIGLITIPLMMYISWAYKKFVPCPPVRCQQEKPSMLKKFITQRRRKNKEKCKDLNSIEKCQDQPTTNQDKYNEPSKDDYMDYLKRSTRECCETVSNVRKERLSGGTSENTQSESISPEAFDKLFEQHFDKCLEDFQRHKKQFENDLESIKECCNNASTAAPNKSNYLECLADLNLDKDFECDPSFYSKNPDTPYVVKDYKCKTNKAATTKEDREDENAENSQSYLKCLTDLNTGNEFEERTTANDYFKNESEEVKTANTECCPKKDAEDTDTYAKAKLDDCGCSPHFNTKDTDKCGTVKGDPCSWRTEKEENDDDALKDFWHACGPPKGLKTGCRAEGCKNPCDKEK